MKKVTISVFLILAVILVFTSLSYPQGKNYIYDEALISIWYPDTWQVSREHVLLLLMPQPKDLQISFQLLQQEDLEKVVQESIKEIEFLYPTDSLFRIDKVVNEIKTVDLTVITADEKIITYILYATPSDKILKVYCNVNKDKYIEYKSDIEKIMKNIKKII